MDELYDTRENFIFTAPNGARSKCKLEVYRSDFMRYVVVFYELPDNPGMSVTNGTEHLATMVCKEYNIDPDEDSVRFFECYIYDDQEELKFDEIIYKWTHGVAVAANWKSPVSYDSLKKIIRE